MKRTIRILSIDGGGIRGLVPASILCELEKTVGPMSSRFHMISGTSTGGIIACGLVNPGKAIPASGLVDLYRKNAKEIFSNTLGAVSGVDGPLYDAAPLEKAIGSTLSGWLREVKAADLLVTSYAIEKRMPWLFKSWDAPSDTSRDFRMVDIARATSAAPTYFPPADPMDRDGTRIALIDGGVFANNPAMCAYVAARRLYPLADSFEIVSIGTGIVVHPYPYKDLLSSGYIGWAQPLLGIMFDGSSETVEYQLDQLAPEVRQWRIQTDLSITSASEAMDDVDPANLDRLVDAGKKTLEGWKQKADLVRMLTDPMIDKRTAGWNPPVEVALPPVFVKPTGFRRIVAVERNLPRETRISAVAAASAAVAGMLVAGPWGAVAALPGWFGGRKLAGSSL